MDKNKTIDVLIPAYNVEKYIGKCLESLISQTYKNLRIVVVDDGSTDDTKQIIEKYQKEHKNIELFTKPNEKSISKQETFCLQKSILTTSLFSIVMTLPNQPISKSSTT